MRVAPWSNARDNGSCTARRTAQHSGQPLDPQHTRTVVSSWWALEMSSLGDRDSDNGLEVARAAAASVCSSFIRTTTAYAARRSAASVPLKQTPAHLSCTIMIHCNVPNAPKTTAEHYRVHCFRRCRSGSAEQNNSPAARCQCDDGGAYSTQR